MSQDPVARPAVGPAGPAAGLTGVAAGPAIGVDIGGTKIAAALVTPERTVLRRIRRPTPPGGSEAVLAAAAEAIRTVSDGAAARPGFIGVGVPGIVDAHRGTVRAASAVVPGWAGANVRDVLHTATGLPVHVENDVRAMAVAEARIGAGRGYRTVLHVSVGTGVGGAITVDGRPLHGARGTAGEIAHLLVPGPDAADRVCGCGRPGHLEAAVAGPGIEAAYARRAVRPPLPLRKVVELMRAGDAVACTVVTQAAVLLGRALAGLVVALDADAVVVGGGVAGIGPEFLAPLADAVHAEVPYLDRRVPVSAAARGTDAPLLGAVLLASEQGCE